jgi:hypothetical protein
MAGMFLIRDLETNGVPVGVDGDEAWYALDCCTCMS